MALDFRERDGLPPPVLFNDDDNLSGDRTIPLKKSGPDSISEEFGSSVCSSLSSLSSTFGSELGSTETDSDEDEDDDFIAELTRQMANYMLEEDQEKDSGKCGSDNHKLPSGSTGSAQYPISGSGCEGLESGLCSPTSVSAQPYPVFPEDQTRTIHFYKVDDQPTVEQQSGSPAWGSRARMTELTQQPEQNPQVQYQKPHKSRRKRSEGASGGGFPPAVAAWRRQQQVVPGWGMRALFLGGPGSRSGSAGTGVFLPRGTAKPVEGRKKTGCSTVLIPARVMQVLQQHFEDINRSRSNNPPLASPHHPLPHEAVTSPSAVQQSSQTRPEPELNPNEMGLPQEWTY